MKKKLPFICLVGLFCFSAVLFQNKSSKIPASVVEESVFVHIARDLELLNSWLAIEHHPSNLTNALRYQIYQEILALHNVNQKLFEESLVFHLESSLERAISVYRAIYASLEAVPVS